MLAHIWEGSLWMPAVLLTKQEITLPDIIIAYLWGTSLREKGLRQVVKMQPPYLNNISSIMLMLFFNKPVFVLKFVRASIYFDVFLKKWVFHSLAKWMLSPWDRQLWRQLWDNLLGKCNQSYRWPWARKHADRCFALILFTSKLSLMIFLKL